MQTRLSCKRLSYFFHSFHHPKKIQAETLASTAPPTPENPQISPHIFSQAKDLSAKK
jgi:hypothetical protein